MPTVLQQWQAFSSMLAVSYAGGGPIGAAWLTERKGEEL